MTNKTLLIITDGIGHNSSNNFNAFASAVTPTYDYLFNNVPYSLIHTYGKFVGLPDGQMGNSEVGHMTIGSGRILYQDLVKINIAIEENTLKDNQIFKDILTKSNNIHLLGLLSDGGVHSHIDHIIAMAKIAKAQNKKVFIHVITDGRDVAPDCAAVYINQLLEVCDDDIKIATIAGRYYAMDRDNNWDRIELAYNALTSGEVEVSKTLNEAIKNSYANGITDEFVKPAKIGSADNGLIKDGDGVIFANFRPDRARQLTRAFIEDDFKGFERKIHPKVNFVTMAQYDSTFSSPVAYLPQTIVNGFGEVVSKAGLTQIRTAETEKYAHVTFFFNGGVEEPYPGEIRLLSDSPKVATYDMQPEMSAYKVKDRLIEELNTGKIDTVILNFANPDMVGHTGNLDAVIAACQAVDNCTGQIVNKVLELDGAVIITADHGNADLLVNPETGESHTAHTVNPVPCILISNDLKDVKLRNDGKLADLTPTMLDLLGVEKPSEMDGETLIIK